MGAGSQAPSSQAGTYAVSQAPPSQAGSQAPPSQAGSQAAPSQAGSQIQSSQYDHRPPPETAVGPQTDSQIGTSSEGGYYSEYGLTEIPEETDTEKKTEEDEEYYYDSQGNRVK